MLILSLPVNLKQRKLRVHLIQPRTADVHLTEALWLSRRLKCVAGIFKWHICDVVLSRSADNSGCPDAANADHDNVEIDKSNVLLMGPTGSGQLFYFNLPRF